MVLPVEVKSLSNITSPKMPKDRPQTISRYCWPYATTVSLVVCMVKKVRAPKMANSRKIT